MEIGKKYLITTDSFFYAPDGDTYSAAFGTLKGVHTAESTLGVSPNDRSTNWFVEIGNLIIAGCQVHYAIRCDSVSFGKITKEIEYSGKLFYSEPMRTRIYNAD